MKINKEIFDNYPGLNIGVVIVKGLDNTGQSPEIMDLINDKQNHIRTNYNTETLSQNPKIGVWREAYRKFGAKPKKNKCSVENLYRMILKGIKIKSINKVVDIYNYISLVHMIPVGGDDLDKVQGQVVLKFAHGDEDFTPLNSEEIVHPKQGEVVYCDDSDVLCRRWNWRECNKTKMTQQTKNVCLIVEGLPPFTIDQIEDIIEELADKITVYCGGEAKTHVLNKNINEF